MSSLESVVMAFHIESSTVYPNQLLEITLIGILKRPDYKELVNTPVMHIPAGSCNAFFKNIMHKSGEAATLENCAYLIAKGTSQKSDITVYEKDDGSKIYSFLSFIWAIPSDIDLDSKW